MRRTTDVVIVGAGIIGLNIALQLARRSSLRITVLERAATVGAGSSGASSAVCRHLYTFDEMVELARDGIAAYRSWPDYLGLDAPVAALREIGVLWLGNPVQDWGGADVERMGRLGVRALLLDDENVRERYPALNPCGLAPDFATGEDHECRGAGSHLFEVDAGYMNPQGALDDLVRALAARGVDLHFGTGVEDIGTHGGAVTEVVCSSGERWTCAVVVNASGPWCNTMLRAAGLEDRWPLVPTRIQVAHLPFPSDVLGDLPVCGDLAGGLYFRPEGPAGRQLIVGSTRAEDDREEVRDPDDFDRLADAEFKALRMHGLKHRIPDLPIRGNVGGYCGLYTVNQADVHPVIGRTPVQGLLVANGFSGHGFKLAPAIGSLVAQDLTGTRLDDDTSVPIEFLGWERTPIALETRTVLA